MNIYFFEKQNKNVLYNLPLQETGEYYNFFLKYLYSLARNFSNL